MKSKYLPLPRDGQRTDGDHSPLPEKTRKWRKWLFIAIAIVVYTIVVCSITKVAVKSSSTLPLPASRSSFPHPNEMRYTIQQTGQTNTSLHDLVFAQPSPENDEEWYTLLRPFNTRIPQTTFRAMNTKNRTSVQLADGSGDYYVTLTVFHEMHCLMRMRWFLYPGYYENKTWEGQFGDGHVVGHFKHCIWSLLESVMCHGDTSVRTFRWDEHKPAPVAESLADRRCVSWDWLYNFTMGHSFLLEDGLLRHPVFGRLDENLRPVGGGMSVHE